MSFSFHLSCAWLFSLSAVSSHTWQKCNKGISNIVKQDIADKVLRLSEIVKYSLRIPFLFYSTWWCKSLRFVLNTWADKPGRNWSPELCMTWAPKADVVWKWYLDILLLYQSLSNLLLHSQRVPSQENTIDVISIQCCFISTAVKKTFTVAICVYSHTLSCVKQNCYTVSTLPQHYTSHIKHLTVVAMDILFKWMHRMCCRLITQVA